MKQKRLLKLSLIPFNVIWKIFLHTRYRARDSVFVAKPRIRNPFLSNTPSLFISLSFSHFHPSLPGQGQGQGQGQEHFRSVLHTAHLRSCPHRHQLRIKVHTGRIIILCNNITITYITIHILGMTVCRICRIRQRERYIERKRKRVLTNFI